VGTNSEVSFRLDHAPAGGRVEATTTRVKAIFAEKRLRRLFRIPWRQRSPYRIRVKQKRWPDRLSEPPEAVLILSRAGLPE